MANRRERRTRGIWMAKRLAVLKNSQILKDADLSGLPEDVIKALQQGTCENEKLQKRYRLCNKIIAEMIELEAELQNMRLDLAQKQKLLRTAKKDISNVQKP